MQREKKTKLAVDTGKRELQCKKKKKFIHNTGSGQPVIFWGRE